jgi:O-antigen ligase
MAFAFSRGAIVAIVLAIPVALAFRMLHLRQLIGVAILGVVLLAAMPHYAERVASIGQLAVRSLGLDPAGLRNADGAARGRLTEMKAAGLLFLEHPMLGAGPGLAPLYYGENASVVGGKVRAGTRRSHNLYLQLAAETGVVGLMAFLAVIFVSLRELDRARRRFEGSDRALWGLAAGLELAIVISLTPSLFLHAAYIRYFWLLIGLAAATSAQPGPPALVAFLARALHETADRLRTDEARA